MNLRRWIKRLVIPPHRELRRPSFPTRDYEPEFHARRRWMAERGIAHWMQRQEKSNG